MCDNILPKEDEKVLAAEAEVEVVEVRAPCQQNAAAVALRAMLLMM